MKLTIIGAAGRMGCALIRCINRAEDLQLAGAVECKGASVIGDDAGTVAGCNLQNISIGDNTESALSDADAAIDFSAREALAANLEIVAASGIPLVIGTTGLDNEMQVAIEQAAVKIPVVHAANMSTGINVLLELTRQAAAVLGMAYDIEIVETHHRYKKDAPSGTALALAESAAEGRKQNLRSVMVHGRNGMMGTRPPGEIGMHALRAGDVVGEHTIHLATEGEKIELTHRASNREAFAVGALRAARWLVDQPAGLYDMRDVLGLRARA